MNYTVTLSDDETYINVRIFVPSTLELRREYLQTMADLANKNGLNRFLVDVRKSPSATNIIEDYQTAYELAHAAGLKCGTRIAALVSSGDASRQFVETAAVNAGYSVAQFKSESEAVEWLSGGQR